MHHRIRKLVLAVFCSSSAAAALAGGVTVNYVHPEQFSDMPSKVAERERTLGELSSHFEKLGMTLPAGQTLAIEVLDIDLAGELVPDVRGEELRVVRKNRDAPMMHLRYTLSGEGKVIASGDAHLTDLAVADEMLSKRSRTSFPQEKRMIDHWWRDTIQPAEVAQR